MSLRPPKKVQKLQAALHEKAKRAPNYRFYVLYDKVYRADVLAHAYHLSQSHGGAPGVDGQRFADIESYGRDRWLAELAEDLKAKRYEANAVRRTWYPKATGGMRPLGIPTIRDRVVQTAVVLVLNPIFEADLAPEQYAYRPGRTALDAIREVHRLVSFGHREVVDADLSGYFDSIPHAELMKSICRRISDRWLLKLIRMWLVAPVEELNQRNQRRRTTCARDEGRGTPQGAPISPLLSNLYMRRFILGWQKLGYARLYGAEIVNYADDFVICCRKRGEEAMAAMQKLMSRLKLTVNESKTRLAKLPAESFNFLGYTLGRCYRPNGGQPYLGTRPSPKAVSRICREISEMTSRRWTTKPVEERVNRLNSLLRGWSAYFRLGPVNRAYRKIDNHAVWRLRQWLKAKHKVKGPGIKRFPVEFLYQELGMFRLSRHQPSHS